MPGLSSPASARLPPQFQRLTSRPVTGASHPMTIMWCTVSLEARGRHPVMCSSLTNERSALLSSSANQSSRLPGGLDRDPGAEIGLLIGQLGADIGHGHGELEAGRRVKCRYKCQEHKYSRGDGHCYKEDVYSFGLCFSDTFLVKPGVQFA